MSKTLALTKTLVEKPSVTPDDQGCQALMIDRLTAIGFECQTLRFGDVDNFWATWGDSGPLLCFAGHTDVVPTGPESSWRFPPFEATEDGGFLFGRGTADMKASLAAMITACEAYAEKHQKPPKGRIGFLITSDEEGPSINGTVKVMEWLADNKIRIDYCLVGEPSSTQKLGDVIKNGRRGSLGCKLRIKGVQGHIAYPHLAKNPVHLAAPFLAELTTTHWDNGNDYFPATSCQISNINGGTGATNVIPGHLDILFNFRYSTELTAEAIQARVQTMLDKHELNVDIEWNLSGKPFLTQEAELVKACQASIKAVTGIETALSTSGGTSDGRFIAPYGVQVVELGPINATIHKIDECVAIDDLEPLSNIYLGIMETLTL